jgi:RNA polymerase sigma factor (TIGR02999 family)
MPAPECHVDPTDFAPSPGDPVDALFATTYGELRRLAHARLRGGGRNTVLDTTALVHETFLKLAAGQNVSFPDRPRFLVYAGRVMRSVIVDIARQRATERRGGGAEHVTFTTRVADRAAEAEEIVRVHEALAALEKVDGRMARVVEMRYFAGMADVEIAEALGVTDRTVRRDWEQARLLLADALQR